MTSHQLAKRLRADHAVFPSAVYRALRELLVGGMIRRVDLLSGYRIAQVSEPIDLLCSQCGAYREIAGGAPIADLDRLARDCGFYATRYVVEVAGLCADCLLTAPQPPSS